MSRTEGINLPRLPTSHARVTSPKSIQPHSRRQAGHHRRSVSEPSYTAYVGTPRQDIPHHVYNDAAMFDDVFDKQGRLLQTRNTPKITAPLNSIGYSSLHDPNCRKLFLNNKRLRSHLMNLGLITDDLRVVASTSEQRQKIRAHELLERKEQLLLKLEDQERQRIDRLQRQVKLPRLYQESLVKAEERRVRAEQLQQMKTERLLKAEQEEKNRVKQKKEEKRKKLQQAIENAKLNEQAKRNAFRAQQEVSEMRAYERQYGKFGIQIANWHRESDRIHNRMVIMERKYWSRMRQQQWLSESYPPPGSQHSSSTSSIVDIGEEIPHAVQPPSQPQPQPDTEETLSPATTETYAPSTVVEDEEPVGVVMEEEETKMVDVETTVESQEDTGGETLQGSGQEDVPHVLPEAAVEDGIRDLIISESPPDKMRKKEVDKTETLPPHGDHDLVISDPREGPIERGTVIPEVTILDPDQSLQELSEILIKAFNRSDVTASGFVNLDDFIQVLNSRDLGLQLNENELLYLAEQADVNKNGLIPFAQVTPHLPPLLLALYSQRAELSMQQFGVYVEEQWCQLYPPEGGVVYFNKLTGTIQLGGRPDDFRPFLRDDVFEESIVDFFETADADKDGIVDYNDFYSLLISPMVSTRIYSNQLDDLLALYQDYSTDGRMSLENFAPIAKSLLLMVYQNTYLDVDEWIELESRKSGTFWFNKVTGETFLPQLSTPGAASITADGTPVSTAPNEMSGKAPLSRKRKKKYSRRVSWDDGHPSSEPAKTSAPPPLRRRQSKQKQPTSSTSTEPVQDEGRDAGISASTATATVPVNPLSDGDKLEKSESKPVENESETKQDANDATATGDETISGYGDIEDEIKPSSQMIQLQTNLPNSTETAQNEEPDPNVEDIAEERPTEPQNERPDPSIAEERPTEPQNDDPASISDTASQAVDDSMKPHDQDSTTEGAKTNDPPITNVVETQDE